MGVKMKRAIVLVFFFGMNEASAVEFVKPECSAKAEVLTITSRKYTKPNREIFYAPFHVLETDCTFLKKGEIYDTTGSNSGKEDLKEGMTLSVGVARNTAMGPRGTIDFLDWRPIKIVTPEPLDMPEDYLRTSERLARR